MCPATIHDLSKILGPDGGLRVALAGEAVNPSRGHDLLLLAHIHGLSDLLQLATLARAANIPAWQQTNLTSPTTSLSTQSDRSRWSLSQKSRLQIEPAGTGLSNRKLGRGDDPYMCTKRRLANKLQEARAN